MPIVDKDPSNSQTQPVLMNVCNYNQWFNEDKAGKYAPTIENLSHWYMADVELVQ